MRICGLVSLGTATAVVVASLVLPSAATASQGIYKSCKALQKDFPNGLARTKTAAKRATAASYERPQVNANAFQQARKANSGLNSPVRDVLCPKRAAGLPSAVRSLVVSVVERDAVTLTWAQPASDGGSRITAYEVVGGETLQVKETGVRVAGLLPGTAYSFTVAAVNRKGAGPAVQIQATTAPPPVKFEIPAGWQQENYSWARPGTTYLRATLTPGSVISLGNAPTLLGRLSATLCSGQWYELAAARIQFLDAAGNPVPRNAVVSGKPDLSKPDPSSVLGVGEALVGYFPSTSDFDRNGCESDSIELAGWQRATQIRVLSVTQPSGDSVLLALTATDQA